MIQTHNIPLRLPSGESWGLFRIPKQGKLVSGKQMFRYEVRLPPGPINGAWINLELARQFGKVSCVQFRAYLRLCWFWDTYLNSYPYLKDGKRNPQMDKLPLTTFGEIERTFFDKVPAHRMRRSRRKCSLEAMEKERAIHIERRGKTGRFWRLCPGEKHFEPLKNPPSTVTKSTTYRYIPSHDARARTPYPKAHSVGYGYGEQWDCSPEKC